MQLERIAPRVGVPIRVHLDHGPEGRMVNGKFGADYKYLVNLGQANLYLKPQAREALVRSGAGEGDDVEILKQINGQLESYEIRVVTNGVASARAARTAVAAPQPIRLNGSASAPPPPAAARPAPLACAEAKSAPQAAQPEPEARVEKLLTRCLLTAARAHWRAYQHALEQGVEIDAPNWEDARCTATSLFIHLSENGGLR